MTDETLELSRQEKKIGTVGQWEPLTVPLSRTVPIPKSGRDSCKSAESQDLNATVPLSQKAVVGDPLAALRRRGVSIRREGERLFVSPPERVTDEVQAFIRANRAAILDGLSVEHADGLVKGGWYGAASVAWVVDADAACGREERPAERLPAPRVVPGGIFHA